MEKILVALCLFFLPGCASLQDIVNVLLGNSSQKITRTPIWVYKPDLRITVDGKTFSGMAVTRLDNYTDIRVQSEVDADRIVVSTCSREDICQIKGGELACPILDQDHPNGRFVVPTDWFGNAGKFLLYRFVPSRKEHDDSCANMQIAVYDKNVLLSWGYVDFRDHPNSNFPAKMTCNATDWTFAGVSVCSAKAGTIQEINFDKPITDYRAESTCNATKISDTTIEFQPAIGWCRASFEQNKKFHDVIINAYDEALIRDGKE